MSVLDVIIGLILLIFAFAGLRKGLIIEAFYLASYIVGIYGAMFFSDTVAAWMSGFIKDNNDIVAIVAFIITFVAVLILVRFLGRLISSLVEAVSLGFLDKIGGFVFGAVKGALITSVFILILNVLGFSSILDEIKTDSFLYPKVEGIASVLYKNHDVVKESIDNGLERIEDVIETSLTK
ncbi:MAG: CvpA family protein [Bacteroidales bacterium]|nr:CvpA family protein [Bacteroidales bacterium]